MTRQDKIVKYVEDFYIKRKYPPTVRDISDGVNIKSTATVFKDLVNLDKEKRLKKDGHRIIPIFTQEYLDRFIKETPPEEG